MKGLIAVLLILGTGVAASVMLAKPPAKLPTKTLTVQPQLLPEEVGMPPGGCKWYDNNDCWYIL
jgi:hypothetical protein